jgi:kinesin family member 11
MSEKSERAASPTRTLKESGTVGTNVQVAVRCRPMNAEEKKLNQPSAVTCDIENKAVTVNFGPPGKKVVKNYNFDMLFGMYSTQDEVFQTVARPIVDEALAGFNCTIFAYGQTGIDNMMSVFLSVTFLFSPFLLGSFMWTT